jgi:AAA domain, putative AbiEii toxin, Type IV TA system/AAA ATPase domain
MSGVLDAVEIRGFRGIREGTIEGLADVNVLVGRNNSGKTTVVEAISRAWPSPAVDVLGRSRQKYWQSVRREKDQVSLDIAATLGATNAKEHLNVVFHFGSSLLGTSFQGGNVLARVVQGAPLGPSPLTVFRPQDLTDGTIDAVLWPGIIAARRDKLLIQALNDIFDTRIEQLQLLPDGRFMLLLPDKGLSLDVFGDGTRAATRCLMVLAAMQDTMLILEEPESHQHPGSLERFATALCALARTQRVQLLLTTHSAECVRAFAKGSAAPGSTFALFHLKLDDGLLWARRFDRDTTETLTASGVDVRFLDLYA